MFRNPDFQAFLNLMSTIQIHALWCPLLGHSYQNCHVTFILQKYYLYVERNKKVKANTILFR